MNWYVSDDGEVYPCEEGEEGEYEWVIADGPFETIEKAQEFAAGKEKHLCSNCSLFWVNKGEPCPRCGFDEGPENQRW